MANHSCTCHLDCCCWVPILQALNQLLVSSSSAAGSSGVTGLRGVDKVRGGEGQGVPRYQVLGHR